MTIGALLSDSIVGDTGASGLAAILNAVSAPGRQLVFTPRGRGREREIEKLRSPLALALREHAIGRVHMRLATVEGWPLARGWLWTFELSRASLAICANRMSGLWSYEQGDSFENICVAEGDRAFLATVSHEREATVWWSPQRRHQACVSCPSLLSVLRPRRGL